jgi:hypothetical protein
VTPFLEAAEEGEEAADEVVDDGIAAWALHGYREPLRVCVWMGRWGSIDGEWFC